MEASYTSDTTSTDFVNMNAMATDLEAQKIDPSDWIFKVRDILYSNQNHVAQNVKFCILKIPEYLRQPSADFTPIGWRFGLHNREKLDTTGSEAIKLSVAMEFGLVGERWEAFCKNIVSDQFLLDIKQCYGVQKGETNLTDEMIRYILALDALFLIFYMDGMGPVQLVTDPIVLEAPCEVRNSIHRIWCRVATLDFCKIENQVPFVLMIKVVEYFIQGRASTTPGIKEGYMRQIIEGGARIGVSEFMNVFGESFKTPNSLNSSSSNAWKHFLAIAYEIICGDEGMEKRSDYSIMEYLHIPSASKLRAAGITIEGISGPLQLLSYKDGCLRLPKINMFDHALGVARNLAWYEAADGDSQCMFSDYIFLMRDLIQTQMDFEILVECGVIHNVLVFTVATAKWINFGQNLILQQSSKEHHDMKMAIQKRCKLRRFRFWDEFRSQFCSRPWIVISVFTISIVSVATLIQTYVAVIGSNGMKPHFP